MGAAWGLPCVLAPLLAFTIMRRLQPRLRAFAPVSGAGAPHVSIILPARNEEANVERCVRSLLASSYPAFDVIVVDDRSEDATPRILARLAAGNARLTVVSGAELPRDWYGKPWACWQGFQRATGAMLLFTDADSEHGPELLPRAVAALQQVRADMVTLMPTLEMKSFWERAVQPYVYIVLGILAGLRFGPPERQFRRGNPRLAIANGQFLLTTRDAYQRVGGHWKVRHTVVEDLLLAREYQLAGRRVFAVLADQDMRTRMYTTLREIVAGWSKNMFVAALEATASRVGAYIGIGVMLVLAGLFVAPTAVLLSGVVTSHAALAGFGAMAFAGAAALMGTVLRMAAQESPLWGVLHPLGALVMMVILLRTAWRGTRRIEWKGRVYLSP